MNTFKKSILAGQRLLGTWMMTGSDTVAETMATVGFDFLVLDQEHVAVDTLDAIRIDRAIRSVSDSTTPLYRLAGNETVLIKRALDGGALSLMIPFINTLEDAKKAIESTFYPPYGKRGFAAMHRASGWGGNPQFVQDARDELCLILQLETPEAIANIDDIARLEGITGFFIGPGDLSSSMGYPGNPSHPEVQAMIKRGLEACQRLGYPCGIVGGNPELANKYQQMGFTFVALASDMSFMLARAKEQLAAIRGETLQIRGGEVY